MYKDRPGLDIAYDYIELYNENVNKEYEIQRYRLEAAMYKAYFYGKRYLAEIIYNQLNENENYRIGDFDGFCYCSKRANAVFRSLEGMRRSGIITNDEYNFCNI